MRVAGVPLDCGTIKGFSGGLLAKGRGGSSGYVCVANVHVFMEATREPSFLRVMEGATSIVPDGMPLVWLLKLIGVKAQSRVTGPDLMESLCNKAAVAKVPIGLLGGRPNTLETLQENLMQRFPGLEIAYAFSPPFRRLTDREEQDIVDECSDAGARIIFVGLGCPKQEYWMARNSGRFPGIMLGVGAAFDYHAGELARAPVWMQNMGCEWLYRLMQEPRRLFRRYLMTNVPFLLEVLLPAMLGKVRVEWYDN